MQQASNLENTRFAPPNTIPMLRPLYKTECHTFEHRGTHILFDVITGGFFQIDDVALNMVMHCEGHTLKELLDLLQNQHSEKEILSAFKELFETGILTDFPPERPQPFAPPDRLEIVHLELEVTTDTLGNTRKDVAYMAEEIAFKAVELLMKESGRIRQCRITFQGGEPLLNPQLVEKAIAHAQHCAGALGKEITFEIVTDERLLNEELFSRLKRQGVDIVIRVDADDHPPLFGGDGPYSLSSNGIQDHIRQLDASVQLQSVIKKNVFDLRSKIRRGLDMYPTAERVSFALEPVQSESDLSQAQTTLEDLAAYVTQHVLTGKTTWIGEFEDCIFQVANQKAFFYHCGKGVRSLSVAPNGTLYAGADRAFSVGDVVQGIDRKKQKTWIKSTHVESQEHCATCWARHLCGGACRIATASTAPPSEIDDARCALTQRTYELAMATCLDIANRDAACLHRRYAAQS